MRCPVLQLLRLEAWATEQLGALGGQLEQAQRQAAGLQRMVTQQQHQARRSEAEQDKLRQRLHKLLGDSSRRR